MERRSGCEGMGKLAEVYDAEMLALVRGLETAIKVQQEMPGVNRRQTRIILFADNPASVTAIVPYTKAENIVEHGTEYLVQSFHCFDSWGRHFLQSSLSTYLHASHSYNIYTNIMASCNQSLYLYVEPYSMHQVINITYCQAPFYHLNLGCYGWHCSWQSS